MQGASRVSLSTSDRNPPTYFGLALAVFISSPPLPTTKTVGMPDYPNLLIIAGGSNGLWVMDADPHSATHRVARVDDSGPSFPNDQLNNRYCNSLAIVTLQNENYALKKHSSNLPRDPAHIYRRATRPM